MVSLHKSFKTMKKERKQYILDFVRNVANSEQIGCDTRKELHAICEEVGVEFRNTVCDNCCRDAAVQVYRVLKGKNTRVCVMKNERDHYVWSANGKAHIYADTLTDEYARELLDKGIVKDDFFLVLPPTEEEEAAGRAYEGEQARLAEEAMNTELTETTYEYRTAATVG